MKRQNPFRKLLFIFRGRGPSPPKRKRERSTLQTDPYYIDMKARSAFMYVCIVYTVWFIINNVSFHIPFHYSLSLSRRFYPNEKGVG